MTSQRLSLFFPFSSLSLSLPKVNYFLLISVLVSLVIALSIFYIFQIEKVTESSYLIKSYTQQIRILTAQNQTLKERASSNLALSNMEKEIAKLNFVKTSQITYIPIVFDYLAKRGN
jgi:hypothetical protein